MSKTFKTTFSSTINSMTSLWLDVKMTANENTILKLRMSQRTA
ncbi:hypothetical protein [Legionella feeleii]|uniref:Uncharacterized protein n=1 Tax=Legionella feeleii TaxID=453 RepID=A0A378J4T1_9GAMM|nr:hypothetical protein [Legionella feeleii]STX39274.1 Uncharacterised protein [Legionella feeleii]